jgi:hypothetical protein
VEQLAIVFFENLALELSTRFIAQIEPLLAEFRTSGGRLRDLERRISDEGPAFQAQVKDIVQSRSPELVAKMNQSITAILLSWLTSKQIRWTPEDLRLSQADAGSMPGPDVPLDDPFMKGLVTITSAIMGVVLGGLCGGTGTALLMSGPGGWVIGAILGVVLTVAVAWGGRGVAQDVTKSIPIPATVAWFALRKVDHSKIKEDMKTQLLDALRPKLRSQQAELRRHVEEIARAQIDDIGALDHL